jgi:hypothetical protein
MSAEHRVSDFLIKNAGQAYCDDCLSNALRIRPRQQVQQKTSTLGKSPLFRRALGRCVRCLSEKLVIESKNSVAQEPGQAGGSVNTNPLHPKKSVPVFTPAELRACEAIQAKDRALREFLAGNALSTAPDAAQWIPYLSGIKQALGNLNNDLSFIATLLVKKYLQQRFAITDFDAGAKAQGASGIDVQAMTANGKSIAGEIKTTRPYQPGFGAAQRTTILKDLARLATTKADNRFMFVIDPGAFQALCEKGLASRAPGVEIVDLVTGNAFTCPPIKPPPA